MKTSIKDKFIENRKDILKSYTDIRILTEKLTKDTPFDGPLTEELNLEMGNFGEKILETIQDTGYAKELLQRDNKLLYSEGDMSLLENNTYYYSDKVNPDKTLEESFFGVFEEGLCLRASNLFNLMAHCLKDEELKIGKKLKLKRVDINDIRASNNVSGILDNATLLKDRTEYNFDIDELENELKTQKYNPDSENVSKIHVLMQRSGMGKSGFTKAQTLNFIEALKINELKQVLYSSKGLAFEAMVHNLSSKERYVEKLKQEGKSQEEIDEYKPEVAVIMSCETKSNSNSTYTIKGESTMRIFACAKGDLHPVQFHLAERMTRETCKRFEYDIPEKEGLYAEFPVSCAVPRNEEELGEEKKKEFYENVSYQTKESDSYKSLFPFKKIVKTIKKIRELNKEQRKIEDVNYGGREI